MLEQSDLLCLEDALHVLACPIGNPKYDFDFRGSFGCRVARPDCNPVEAIARVGAIDEYGDAYQHLLARGVRLVHTPQQHLACSQLPYWYEPLRDITPRSLWFNTRPSATDVGKELGWPVFIKGARQTSRHQRALSIVNNPDECERALDAYENDPILQWQEIVCRQFVPLRRVEDIDPERIPSSFEFRSFWWHNTCVGFDRYWTESTYAISKSEQERALRVGRDASQRIDAPFKVIDLAQTETGDWIVIELNDGQESGYAAIHPLGLWRRLIDAVSEA